MIKLSEKALNRLAMIVVARPILAIILSLLFCLFFAWHIKDLRFDTTTEGLLLSDDPWIVIYNDFLDRYGRDEMVIVSLQADDIFTPKAIAKIKHIENRIENEVPYLSRIDSIVTARDTRGEDGALIVGKLFDGDPQSSENFQALKARALRNPFYVNRLISDDAKIAVIVIRTKSRVATLETSENQNGLDDLDYFSDFTQAEVKLEPLSDEQNSEIVKTLRKIIDSEQSVDMPLKLLGSPVVTDDLKRFLMSDAKLFVVLLIAVIVILLYLFFRRLSGVIYPLLIALLSLISMLGLMSWAQSAFKLPTQVVPAFLLAVGVGAAVHLITIFYRSYDQKGDRKQAVIDACSHSSLAIFMTALTTMAGIGSFVTAVIEPFEALGIYVPFGVFITLVLTLTLLPALLVITPIKKRRVKRSAKLDRLLIWTATLSVKYPKRIVACFALALLIAIALLPQVRLSHYMLGWFPKSSDTRIATDFLDQKIRGTVTIEALIDFGEENALYDPLIMNALDNAINEAKNIAPIGDVLGIPIIIKEINRALNDNDENFYTIPESRGAIAEELLLFSAEGSDDLGDLTNANYSETRITHKTPFLDAIEGRKTIDKLAALYKGVFPNAKIEITGLLSLVCRTFSAASISTAISYIVAIFTIGAMMIIAFGSFKLGLFSMIPNLTPIIIGMAYMVTIGVPFDMFVMLTGSIVLGLVVDDTIHFIHNFKRYYLEDKNAQKAIEKTLLSAGRAMSITSAVLAIGFSVYLFAFMQNIVNFGLIAGVCIILALLADFLFTPALLILWLRKNPKALF
ncbi:MAG: MMPL family transporter [Helicobacteraceae bacterium]|nr:MMPL family transporter [Helicobacteraceae bacterium]